MQATRADLIAISKGMVLKLADVPVSASHRLKLIDGYKNEKYFL